MSVALFHKTDAGRAELTARKAGLSAATRSVLIMVNGQATVADLARRGLADLQGQLDTLLALGLIEAVVKPAPSAARAAPTPASGVPPAAERSLDPLRREALHRLTPHFGPDTPLIAQGLIAARTPTEFNAALDALAAKLAIYMGRKSAQREIDGLRA